MSLPCIAAARRFDVHAHRRFWLAGQPVGWIRECDVAHLTRWPDVFTLEAGRVELAGRFDADANTRSAALAAVIGALAADGAIRGWRDEIYGVRNAFDDAPLAYIERAAARFFGTMTYAVHLNGIVKYADRAPQLWIARRSEAKATDPGMLDNVVAGGIAWGFGVEATLVKECWEEAGIEAALALRAVAGRTVHVLQSIPEGTQAEQIFVYDLTLADDFTPRNQDGEVSEHRLARIEDVARWIEEGTMTVDASLATLDTLLRHRWIDEAACAGLDALVLPPTPPA